MEDEFESSENEGVIEPVQFSNWAAPIASVVRCDGSVRICRDYKVTPNQKASLICIH